MRRQDFSYQLPHELIAQEPWPRGTSRMMVVEPRDGPPSIRHELFGAFPEVLQPEDLVVVNDTRVIPARLFASPSEAMQRSIEILLTRRTAPLQWECWCKPARRVRQGHRLTFSPSLQAEVMEKRPDGSLLLQFLAKDEPSFWFEVYSIGVPPLPPYISRPQPRQSDQRDYQTVYAARQGAIAAPTAGLHFTQEILDRISERLVRLTLHVGIGTFKPVKADSLEEHQMDAERYEISPTAAHRLNEAVASGRRIVAVGTTTVRALESAFLAGEGRFSPGKAETSLFITPGFSFRVVDRLLTNFHLPESTLLMLVSAFAGVKTIRHVYGEAIARRYRFYSYGDCMFLTHRGTW
jgi:S-adenosylmethionine:tRNA ribosyltransferase-isomerase